MKDAATRKNLREEQRRREREADDRSAPQALRMTFIFNRRGRLCYRGLQFQARRGRYVILTSPSLFETEMEIPSDNPFVTIDGWERM